MQYKYCIPIIKSSKKEVLEIIQKNLKNFYYIEIWMDYIEDLDLEFIEKLKTDLKDRLVLLFRRQNLETPKMSWDKKLEIINLLENSNCLLDLDIYNQKKEIQFINKENKKINKIISFHDYKQTPSKSRLDKIINLMKKENANVYKIATFCNSEKDALTLLELLADLKNKKLEHIILGMGEFGVITRIFGTMWGNKMIFAPLTLKEKSAPGQLTKGQLEDIFKTLES